MQSERTRLHWLAVVAVCAGAVALVVAGAAPGAAQEQPEERIEVAVQADGDATMTTTFTYDLSDEAERQAFQSVEADSDELAATYVERLRGIAAQVAAEEGRDVTVRDPRVEVEQADGVGVVSLSVTWTNLAAVEGDRLVLSAPFDDAFQPDRPLVVRAPQGYAVSETAVAPAEQSGREARWAAGNDLSGFSATMTPADALALPIAVPVAGLLLAAAGLAARRRSAGF